MTREEKSSPKRRRAMQSLNPELQAAKFDPDGTYVRQWAPEYAGDEAPEPIVDLKATRDAALAAYEAVKNSR